MKVRIDKAFLRSLKPDPEKKEILIWDTALRRFGLRMSRNGRKTWMILYTPAGQRRQRMLAIGDEAVLTLDQARDKARRLLMRVDAGEDPAGEKAEARRAVTFGDISEQYLEAARAGLVITNKRRAKSDSTLMLDEGRVANHVKPHLGAVPAQELAGRVDLLQRTYDAIAAKSGATGAKRVVGLVGGIWAWATARGHVSGPNPARGVVMAADSTRERVLSLQELVRLGEAIEVHADTVAAPVLTLIALTGLRSAEASGLKWAEIDGAGSCLRLEATKTGRSLRPIGRAALEHLGAVPRLHDVFVFPSRTGHSGAEIKKTSRAIFSAAGLLGDGPQTLRRTFASIAADMDYSDSTIGELIGHARRGVTAKHYLRRSDPVLISAADAIAEKIAKALSGEI